MLTFIKNIGASTLGLVATVALVGCQPNEPAPSQPAPSASSVALAQGAISRDWAERKTVQRELTRLVDPASRRAVAIELLKHASNTEQRRILARAARQAFELSPEVALGWVAQTTADTSLPLRQRVLAAQALASEIDQNTAPPGFAMVARDVLQNTPRDDEMWGIGLRLLARYAPAEAEPELQRALGGAKAERRAAAAALSEQSYLNREDLLAELVLDPDRYVRREALKALQQSPSENAARIIQRVLETESEPSVCSRAIEAAEALPGATAFRMLAARRLKPTGCGIAHRFAFLSSMRRLVRTDPGLIGAGEALEQILADPTEPAEAAMAAATLGRLPLAREFAEAGVYEGLIALTSRSLEKESMRIDAIQALGAVGGERATARLLALLGRVHESPRVLLAVVEALDAAGGVPADRRFLYDLYLGADEDPTLRAAVAARKAVPPPVVVEPVVEAKHEHDAPQAPLEPGPREPSPLADDLP